MLASMEIQLSTLRGATVLAPDAPASRLRDLYLDDLYWVVRDLVLDSAERSLERPLVVPVGMVREHKIDPPLLTLGAAPVAPSRAWQTDRRSAAHMLTYTVEAPDGPIGRAADIVVDSASWAVRAINVRVHAPSSGILRIPVAAVAALLAIDRRMLLRLDREKLRRFRYPRAVGASV
jgi:hypothetical protein